MPPTLKVIDSHTGGEPTRIIFDGGPDFGPGTAAEQMERFRQSHDELRRAVITEPRGSDVLVGGWLVPPSEESCSAGIIFFNNHGFLGMCGHGTIGLMATLKYLGRIEDGLHRIETPVGIVTARVEGPQATLENVASYRLRKDVAVDVPGLGTVVGDIAWGGNWFFLVREHGQTIDLAHVRELTDVTLRIRDALAASNITATDGAWIDHIELFGDPQDPSNHSRNFVLCPGGAYDRSPCGTGTSAKLACLAADQKLQPGEDWRQESVLGSIFTGSYRVAEESLPGSTELHIRPTISGTAFITAESQMILDPADPFCMGISE